MLGGAGSVLPIQCSLPATQHLSKLLFVLQVWACIWSEVYFSLLPATSSVPAPLQQRKSQFQIFFGCNTRPFLHILRIPSYFAKLTEAGSDSFSRQNPGLRSMRQIFGLQGPTGALMSPLGWCAEELWDAHHTTFKSIRTSDHSSVLGRCPFDYTEDLSFSARLAQRQAWKAACNPSLSRGYVLGTCA